MRKEIQFEVTMRDESKFIVLKTIMTQSTLRVMRNLRRKHDALEVAVLVNQK